MKNVVVVALLLVSLCGFGQDLQIKSVTGSKSFDQYQALTATVTVQNTGIVASAQSLTDLVLSVDNQKDNSDYYLLSFDVPPLQPGETFTHEHRCVLNFIKPGNCNLIVTADSYSQVTETDETNNSFVSSGYVIGAANVDLVVSSLDARTTTLSANNIFYPTFTGENNGTTDLDCSVTTRFFLSSDATLDASDPILGDFGSDFLTGSDIFSTPDGFSLVIPSVNPGTYYLIAAVDYYNFIDEIDEGNNTPASTPLTVTPSNIDIEPVAISVINFFDGYINFDLEVINHGTTTVGNFEMELQISKYPDGSYPVPLGIPMNFGEPIAAGASVVRHVMAGFNGDPPGTPGVYYVVMQLNPGNEVAETNYTNNRIISSQPFNVPVPPTRSLTITAAEWVGAYDNTDKELVLNIDFYNSGQVWTMYPPYEVVIRDSKGTTVHTEQRSQTIYAMPGSTTTLPWTITLVDPLLPGDYTVQISCSNLGECYTNTFALPLNVEVVQYTLSGTIKGQDGTPLTSGKLFLYQKDDLGKVKFIQKIVPVTSSDFSFPIDNHDHTLYFIPNDTLFPGYIPTIFGKTITLNSNSFFSLEGDSTVVFEIIKPTPLPGGRGVITGSVIAGGTGGRIGGDHSNVLTSEDPYVLILLDQNDLPLAFTETATDGTFHFEKLPVGKYKLLLQLKLDQSIEVDSYPVDISLHDANVEFVISPAGLTVTEQAVLYTQSITFDELPAKVYQDEPFQLEAVANSGLPISYVSSDESIARIDGNLVTIMKAGTVSITASQNGNVSYQPASQISRTLTIAKAAQTISFTAVADKETLEGFDLEAEATSGLEIQFSSNNMSVAVVAGNHVSLVGSGTASITATQEGNENFLPAAPVVRTFNVEFVLATELSRENIALYPNPTTRWLTIESNVPLTALTIMDAVGKRQTLTVRDQLIDLQEFSPGVYFLKVEAGKASLIMKVVKQ